MRPSFIIFFVAFVTLTLAGCTIDREPGIAQTAAWGRPLLKRDAPWTLHTPFGILYGRVPREIVDYPTKNPAGTIVVETSQRRLYYVLGDGAAIRYGIAVGMEGYEWAGVSTVSAKREWPDWTPTPKMLVRFPNLPRHMAGGPDNPLGARALYLGATLYRIHGTNEPWKIGTDVSSGCIRMSNEDAIDLYNRTKIGATVIVRR